MLYQFLLFLSITHELFLPFINVLFTLLPFMSKVSLLVGSIKKL